MDKSIMRILSVGILAIIVISVGLFLTGMIPGAWADRIITFAGIAVGLIIFILIRRKKNEEKLT